MSIDTPKEFFENALPKRFNAAKAAGVNVTVQVNISGSNGGDWCVTIRNQAISIKEGIGSTPTLVLGMAEKDFLDLVNRKMSAEKAFFSGKIRFKGDISLALKLREAGFL